MIASRRTRLARAQAEEVGGVLARLHPTLEVQYHWVESEGDQRVDQSLAEIGGKGLFAKAVEKAVLARQADLAVHSLKDMPVEDTPGLVLAAIPPRHDARDCFISAVCDRIQDLPQDAVVGTASPRRAAQVLRLRPDVRIELLRGAVETRLRKVLDERQFDAALMAVSGLHRAGLGEYAQKVIDPDDVLPSNSQGALAVQCRIDDHVALSRCLPLNDPLTSEAVHAERTIVAGLHGDCHSPIGSYVEPVKVDGRYGYRVRACVLALDGSDAIDFDQTVPNSRLSKTVREAVEFLQSHGSAKLLQASH